MKWKERNFEILKKLLKKDLLKIRKIRRDEWNEDNIEIRKKIWKLKKSSNPNVCKNIYKRPRIRISKYTSLSFYFSKEYGQNLAEINICYETLR